jgi:hypothetical protein
MNIHIQQINNTPIAFILSGDVVITNVDDALDLLGNASYKGAYKIILNESQITPSFFDLSTGIAGDVLQKFSNYNVQLAIVGDFSKYTSKSLVDFIRESNKVGRILFVSSPEEAFEGLTK